ELLKRLGFDDSSLERIDMQQRADVEKWVRHNSRLTHRPTSTPARPLPPVISNACWSWRSCLICKESRLPFQTTNLRNSQMENRKDPVPMERHLSLQIGGRAPSAAF